MSKKDTLFSAIIGAEVGLVFQPLIYNLWPDIQKGIFNLFSINIERTIFIHLGVLVFFAIIAPIALYILSLISKYVKVAYQFGKFAAVGSSNTFLDIGLLNLAIMTMDLKEGTTKFFIVATSTAIVSTVNSYLWNKFWTFEAGKREEKRLWEIVKFYAVTGAAALVNGAITSFATVQIVGGQTSGSLAATVGKIIGILSAFLINFLGYKFIVFKKEEDTKESTNNL
jgi:putative flippase GtrA